MQTVQEVVCSEDNLKMRELTLKALDDVIEYCVASQSTNKKYPDNIESLILSRLYHYAIRDSQKYSWHVFCSEVHDTNQASVKDLHSNHEILVSNADNVKDPQT